MPAEWNDQEPVCLMQWIPPFKLPRPTWSRSVLPEWSRSVYDYILYRRVLQAKEMIHSCMNLNETAYRCGFSDYSSFLRSFKKMTGMSPNAYRKMAKGPEVDRMNE